MRKTLPWIIAAMAAMTVWVPRHAGAEGIKVAVIDVNRILNESEIGKAAKKKMEDRFAELKKGIDKKSDEARKMKEDIEKQKILLGKEKLKEKEDALNARVAELRQLTQEAEKEMQSRQNELTRDILKVIEAQVDKVVKEEKLDLVLERTSGVIHVDPSLNITDKVLALVNKEKSGAK